MTRLVWVLIGLGFLSPAAVWASERPDKTQLPPLSPEQRYGASRQDYVAGELLVKFKPYADASVLARFNAQVRAAAATREAAVAAFHAHFNTQPQENLPFGWQRIKLPAGKQVPAMLREVQDNALVETAAPNGLVYADAQSVTYTAVGGSFDDTYYVDGHSQWWINRTRGDVAKAAGYLFAGASDVIVAVLDTGLDSDHAEFTGRTVAGYDYVNGDSDPDDDNEWMGTVQVRGHGTHTCGMIAALANSNQIAGTAWDSRIKLMPVKVLDSNASGTFANIVNGINYAMSNGAHIINMSFTTSTNSSLISTAIASAVSAGLVLVASAGNENVNLQSSPRYPACYSGVMSIGASDAEDWVTYYSNWSNPAGLVDCVAPGGALMEYYTGYPEDNGVTSTARAGGVSAVDGTSFSAPQVAALAALLKLQWPSRTAAEIQTIILNNCIPTRDNAPTFMGAGKINIPAALAVYQTPTATPTRTFTPTNTATPTLTFTPTATRTLTATPTPSVTPTSSASATPSATPTASPTASASLTPSPTPSRTATATATPSASASLTPSPTLTSSCTATRSATATPTPTASVSLTPSPTFTRSCTPSASASASLTPSPTPTSSCTPTRSATFTSTPTASASLTPSATFTRSCTPSPSFTQTRTRTITRTVSPTSTITTTRTATPLPTPTTTATPLPTETAVISPTVTPSMTVVRSPTSSSTPTYAARASVKPLAFPNPAASHMNFLIPLPAPALLTVTVYNLAGERVAELRGSFPAGAAQLAWDCRQAASGVYFVKITADSAVVTVMKVGVK